MEEIDKAMNIYERMHGKATPMDDLTGCCCDLPEERCCVFRRGSFISAGSAMDSEGEFKQG